MNDAELPPSRIRIAASTTEIQPDLDGQKRLILGLMLKYWTPGHVKTRLAAAIGFTPAAVLHRVFALHLCRSLAISDVHCELVVAPDDDADRFRDWLVESDLAAAWGLMPQGDGDLGIRMERWFAHRLSNAGSRAILIGADCPMLTTRDIDQAFVALDSFDVVLGPAADGGYYLVGVKFSDRRSDVLRCLFTDIPWSTSSVLELTQQRLRENGIRLALLDEREDIDTGDELTRLCQQLDTQAAPENSLRAEIDRVMNSVNDAETGL